MNQPICTVAPAWPDTGPSGADFAPFASWNQIQINFAPERAEQPMAVGGTIRNLRFALVGGASVSTRTLTLTVNGVATLMSITLAAADTYGEDLGHDIAVNAGDYITFHIVDAGISPIRSGQITFEFDAGDDVTSLYCACATRTARITVSTPVYDAPLSGGQFVSTTTNDRESIVGCDGTVTALAIRLERAPGVGSSRTFVIYKNGVKQDGSGGTVDTRVTISDANRQGLTTFALPVVGLDLLYLEGTGSGSPVTTGVNGTTAFVATNPGEFQVCGSPDPEHTLGTTEFNIPQGRGGTWVGAAAENTREALGSINAFSVQTLYSRVLNVVAAGETFTHTIRKNGIDTVQTNTLVEGETFKFNVSAAAVEITADDVWSMKSITDATHVTTSTWTFVASPLGSPSGGSPSPPESSPPEEPPVRVPPVVTPPSPDECPCPPPSEGGAPSGGGGTPPGDPGNSGGNPGGEGWSPDAFCDGLGQVNTYGVPDPGESMVDKRDTVVWAEVRFKEFDDVDEATEATEYWSMDCSLPDAPDAYGGRKDGRMFGVSPITRGLSDENGNYSGSHCTLQVNDKDRETLRARLGEQSTKYVWDREVFVYTASEANRRSGYTLDDPRTLCVGMTNDIGLGGGFTASIAVEDRVVSQFGRFGPDRSFPSRLLTSSLLPGLPRELDGKPQRWIFGIVSDEGAVNIITGLPASKGLVPLSLVGSLGSEDEYHLAAHPIGGMTLYGSDGLTPPSRVLLGDEEYRVELVTLTDEATGIAQNMTHVFIPTGHVATEAHKNGGVTLAANVCGVLGSDGTETITQLFYIYQAVFEMLILADQESVGGYYGAIAPQWADGRSMVHSPSFEDAQALSIERIGGNGYMGGFVLGGPENGAVSLRELLRRMSNSGDCRFTQTMGGQVKCVPLDDTTDVDSTPILREPARLRALPTPSYAIDQVENPVLCAFDWDDDKQRWRVPQARIQNDRALLRMGRPRPSPQPVEMRCVRDYMTARDVASRRLLRRQYPPAYFPVVESVDGLDRDPGDVIRITSIEGPGQGCVERPMFIEETTYDPNARRVMHKCRDLSAIIEGFGEWSISDVTWDTATEQQQEDLVFWANDDDLIPTELAPGQEWR
jgi:hypothetical protein